MINKSANINPKIFDDDVERLPTRNGYGKGLVAAAEENENVVALCADLAESTRTEEFANKFPERYFEVGVAEQNMAAVAAGLGVAGKIPFIASYATFSPGRNWEQIRTTISYNNANVKIAGHHAGISVGADGATHQAIEDIATMRVMANMSVFVPCDAIEAKKITMAAAKISGPVYIRLARAATPIITTEATPFDPGRAEIFWAPPKSGKINPACLIIGAGALLHNALLAAKELEKEKIGVVVLNSHTIKPLAEEIIIKQAQICGGVVTVEEHQVSGGLGGAVSELLAKHFPVPMEFIGMQNTFGESGAPEKLMKKYNLNSASIVKAVKKVIKRKNG